MSCIDVWVIAVPNKNKERYVEVCKETAKSFKDNGAISTTDGWGSDVPDGKVTSFPMAVNKKEDETVAFGMVRWPDSETRAKGMKAVESNPAMQEMPKLVDGIRIIFATFDIIHIS